MDDRPAAPGSSRQPRRRRRAGSCPSPVTGQELVLLGVIAVLWIVLAFATPAFMTAGSIQPLLVSAPIALIGVGMTIIIITGGIDVSVGRDHGLLGDHREAAVPRLVADPSPC